MGQSANFSAAAVFVRVVEAGSLRGAARELGMPKSNVSRRLADLETQLGVQLLQRTTRRLRLTDAGEAYFRGARAAVTALLDAERDAHALHATPRGLLRVTAPVTFAAQYLWPVVHEYLRAYPEVQVSVHLTDRVVDLLKEGFDVAVRAGPMADSSLVAKRLQGTPFFTVASPELLSAHPRPRKPEELAKMPCVVRGEGLEESWRFRRAGVPFDVAVRGRFGCTSFLMLRDAALASHGVAHLPALFAAEGLRNGKLVRLFERFEMPSAPLHLVYPSQRHVAPKVRAFVDALSAAFTSAPWSALPLG